MSKVIYLNEDHDDLMIGGTTTPRVETEHTAPAHVAPIETSVPAVTNVHEVSKVIEVDSSPEVAPILDTMPASDTLQAPPREYTAPVHGGAEHRVDADSDDDSAYDDDNLDSASSVSSVLTENLLKLDPLYIRLTKFLQHEDQNITEVLFGIQTELKTLNLNLQAHLQR